MLKAGALYFSIVIAFFIAVISASLIMLAAHYRNSYLKEIRFNRLQNNLSAGVKYVLASDDLSGRQTIDLFGDESDSLIIERRQWGLYELAIVKTFILQDTLKKAIWIGRCTDSTVLYLSDEDRPLSVSGNTKITGNVEIPKAGMKKSYAEGKPYANDKMIYGGKSSFSSRTLKPVDQILLKLITDKLEFNSNHLPELEITELNASFLDSTQSYKLAQKANLKAVNLNGNIMLFADSSITISASSKLNGVQLFAPFIKIEDGFKGNCQLFAMDSIRIGNQVNLDYPSVVAVIRTAASGTLPQITLGENVSFEGIIFTHEDKRSALQTIISLGKKNHIKGEIFSTGMVKLEKGIVIDGKVSCNRFIMQTPTTLYENFLIDVTFNNKARSKYYLSTNLFDNNKEKKVLKWLN
jgi:cytoskeletal protein CcmA (bactofilin family)